MPEIFSRLLAGVPSGCLVAIAAHFVRFGDDHAFGAGANEALVALATGGSVAIALAIVCSMLSMGSTTVTGTIARARVSVVLPNAAHIFAFAAALYYGIETLEGNGIELGIPTLVLALLAALVAWSLRALCAQLARFVDAIVRELVALLCAGPGALAKSVAQAQPVRAQTLRSARRLGRAPPNERRFF